MAAPGEVLAPLRGRVVDAAEGRGLAHVNVTILRDGRRLATSVSDRDGHFETQQRLAAGRLTVVADDGYPPPTRYGIGSPRQEARLTLDWRPGAAPIELPFEAGPSFQLELEPQPFGSLDAYEVRLTASSSDPTPTPTAPVRSTAVYFVSGRALRFTAPDAHASSEWLAALRRRKRGELWARFGPIDVSQEPADATWNLTVAAKDGSLEGTLTLPGPPRGAGGTQQIALREHSSLEVFAIDEAGFAIEGTRLDLDRIDADGARTPLTSILPALESAGAARPAAPAGTFEHLPPGEYVVRGESMRAETLERRVRLPDDPRQIELVMRRLPLGGPIRGSLQSARGALRPADLPRAVTLTRAGDETILARAAPQWIEDEGRAEFVFERLPRGLYDLGLDATAPGPVWDAPVMPLAPPFHDARFVLRDDQCVRLEFEVVDRETGARLSDYAAAFRVGGAADLPVEATAGTIRSIDRDAELEWWIATGKHRIASGTMADFHFDGDVGRARVELERGFTCKIVVVDQERAPLRGVRLFLDGRVVATSDANGHLEAELDALPEALDLRYEADGVVYRPVGAELLQLPYTPFLMLPE